jgi:hypothetical protein
MRRLAIWRAAGFIPAVFEARSPLAMRPESDRRDEPAGSVRLPFDPEAQTGRELAEVCPCIFERPIQEGGNSTQSPQARRRLTSVIRPGDYHLTD